MPSFACWDELVVDNIARICLVKRVRMLLISDCSAEGGFLTVISTFAGAIVAIGLVRDLEV